MLKVIILLLFVNVSYGYDLTIKDNRGRTIGYFNKDINEKVIDIIDTRGRLQGYIKEDKIKDEYGNTDYYIEEE